MGELKEPLEVHFHFSELVGARLLDLLDSDHQDLSNHLALVDLEDLGAHKMDHPLVGHRTFPVLALMGRSEVVVVVAVVVGEEEGAQMDPSEVDQTWDLEEEEVREAVGVDLEDHQDTGMMDQWMEHHLEDLDLEATRADLIILTGGEGEHGGRE